MVLALNYDVKVAIASIYSRELNEIVENMKNHG